MRTVLFRTLLFTKIVTLLVALAMCGMNIVKYRKRPCELHRARVRMFAALACAAGILIGIHPYPWYSLAYFAGLSVVGLLIAYTVRVQLRSKRL